MSAETSSSSKPKRQLVKAACQSCQKRKVKCSGERPSCTLCQTRGQVCVYDSEAGITRVEAVRRRNKELIDQISDYELVYNTLQNTPDSEAYDHLQRLRGYSSMEEYAQVLREEGLTNPGSKKRQSDRRGSLDGNGFSQLSPRSTTSLDAMDEEPHNSNGQPASTEYMSQPQAQSMIIDPQLESQIQSSYNFPQASGSYLQSLTEMWSYPEQALEQQRNFLPNSQEAHTQGYNLYDTQMQQTNWTAGGSRNQAKDGGRRP